MALQRLTVSLIKRDIFRYAQSTVTYNKSNFDRTDRKFSDGPTKSLSLQGRDFLTLKHFEPAEIEKLLWTAKDLKMRIKGGETIQPLVGKNMSMIFQKRSTRTRISTETGMHILGGHAVFLGPEDVHFRVNESIKDSARVLSRLTDIILARVYEQDDLEILANEASVPVISGLSDMFHPLQILADFMTMQERFGYLKRLKVAWVGDGNNILQSFMFGCAKMGMDLRFATPIGYEPDQTIMAEAIKIASQTPGAKLNHTHDPMEAVYRADVIVTDTWVSMGQEEEKKKRVVDFEGYQVNRKMVDTAAANWIFLHCLPRKPEEVTDDVFYDLQNSMVWQEAENRKWTTMAVILHLLADHTPVIKKPVFEKPS